MTTLSPTTMRRLHVQGFTADDAWLAEVSLWLRLSPALCGTFAALGTATASPTILFALAGIALLGAVMPFHSFDLIYDYGIRFLVGKRPLPSNGAPRRFGCAIAAVTEITPELSTSGGTSDGRFIARIAREVVEFGPVAESMHGADERVRIADLGPLSAIYERAVEALLASN